jgi:NAD(P)H-hydrate epimerase
MLVLTAAEMAALDQKTIQETGIPGIVLMENAARGAAAFFLRTVPDLVQRHIAVLAGSGNNAGDGFALARIFHSKGAKVSVVCLRSPQKLKGDALANFTILERIGVPVSVWNEESDFEAQWQTVSRSEAVIDALLGTGLKSEVKGLYREVIQRLNTLRVPILSLDVPSGLDASSGVPLGAAVKATATATFGFVKLGCVVAPGPEFTGKMELIDIGIPPGTVNSCGFSRWYLDQEQLCGWLPPRDPATHKGKAGHVCVLAGSPGKTGAATLVCLGAARAGAGLVTLFVPQSLNPILEVKLTEAMTLPIPETALKGPSLAACGQILDFLRAKQVLAIGPGISTQKDSVALVKELLLKACCPVVVDADAITALSDEPATLRKCCGPLVLTPHPGEMAAICHCSVPDIEQNRIQAASKFSKDYGVVLVLKGRQTVIAAPDGKLAINSTGNPAMASGGMGDTLTGIIAGLIAQGIEPFRAACLGVYVHGAACDLLFGGVADRGLLATDMLEKVPCVLGMLERGENL